MATPLFTLIQLLWQRHKRHGPQTILNLPLAWWQLWCTGGL